MKAAELKIHAGLDDRNHFMLICFLLKRNDNVTQTISADLSGACVTGNVDLVNDC